MEIGDLIPELRPLSEQVSQSLRFVCFFVLTASIIVKAGRSHGQSPGSLFKPMVTATILCGIIATLPGWFNLVRDAFWAIAISIRSEFASNIAPTGTALIQLIDPPAGGINWMDVGQSFVKAVLFSLGWMVVCFGALIQVPMMLIQFISECLCYMFLPVAISLLALESTRGLGIRYIQQTLAILAWPIGFAVVDLVGYALLSGPFAALDNVLQGKGYVPALMIPTGLVALWLVLGSLSTPILMQMLICSGVPMSSAIGQTLQTGATLAGFAGLAKGVMAGALARGVAGSANAGTASAGASSAAASSAQQAPSPSARAAPGDSRPMPKPPANPPQQQSDPNGDLSAASVLSIQRIPQPVRY